MRRNVLRGLRLWSALLVASGYFALSTTPAYGASVLFVPLVFLPLGPLGEWLDSRYLAYRKVTMLLNLAYLVSIPLTFSTHHLMQLVIALVIYIQVYTVMHRKTSKNYHHLFLMSFFLLLAATVQSPEPAIGLAMASFLVSAIVALTMLQLWTEVERAADDRPPDIVPLDAFDATLAVEQPKRLLDWGVALSAAAVSAVALVIAAAIFLVTPRMEAGILGRTTPQTTVTDVTDTVDLSESGLIQRDERIVMRVEFPDEPNGSYTGQLLWRTAGLSTYRDARWFRGSLTPSRRQPMLALSTERYRSGESENEIVRVPFHSGRKVRQAIYLDHLATLDMPSLPVVQRIHVIESIRGVELDWASSRDYSVGLARMPRQSWLQYDAWSEVGIPTADELRAARTDYTDELPRRDYETLTEQDLLPETLTLAKTLTADATTVYDKVAAIGAFFNGNGFLYSLEVPKYPADHPVDAFVNSVRLGHCELFASAMALMARSQGIPARVVSGYRGGEWAKGDRSCTVRADMAHLWVEVYFLNIGWVAFDPSPPDQGQQGLGVTHVMKSLSRYAIYLKMLWYRDIIGFNKGLQLDALRNLALGVFSFGQGLGGAKTDASETPPWTPLPFLLALALVALLVAIHWGRRLRRGNAALVVLSRDQRRATRLYGLLRRRLTHCGLAVHGLSAEEISDLVGRSGLRGKPEARQLVEAYNEARFGGMPFPSDRYRRFKRLLAALRPPAKH